MRFVDTKREGNLLHASAIYLMLLNLFFLVCVRYVGFLVALRLQWRRDFTSKAKASTRNPGSVWDLGRNDPGTTFGAVWSVRIFTQSMSKHAHESSADLALSKISMPSPGADKSRHEPQGGSIH